MTATKTSNAVGLLCAAGVVLVAWLVWGDHPRTVREVRKEMEAELLAFEAGSGGGGGGTGVCGSRPRVLVSFNACVDVIVDAQALMDALGPALAAGTGELQQSSLTQLIASLMYHHRRGVATERITSDAALFQTLTAAAERAQAHRTSLGGNAAIMSTRLALEGCAPHVVSHTVGPRTRELFHANVTFAGASQSAPERTSAATASAAEDDVHLIIEYGKGDVLFPGGRLQSSPRANRYILTFQTPQSVPLDELRAAVRAEPTLQLEGGGPSGAASDQSRMATVPDLGAVVLSGFHLLQDSSADERRAALSETAAFLRELPPRVIRHVEVASMPRAELYVELATELLSAGSVTSIGANEQETAALYDALTVGEIGTSYASTADVGQTLVQMREVMRQTGLERFHMHNIAFQAVCERDGRETRFSLLKAVLTATRQACGSADGRIRSSHVELMLERKRGQSATQCTSEEGVTCCVAPVLVCKRPVHLVGLGDHISAAGLTPYL